MIDELADMDIDNGTAPPDGEDEEMDDDDAEDGADEEPQASA